MTGTGSPARDTTWQRYVCANHALSRAAVLLVALSAPTTGRQTPLTPAAPCPPSVHQPATPLPDLTEHPLPAPPSSDLSFLHHHLHLHLAEPFSLFLYISAFSSPSCILSKARRNTRVSRHSTSTQLPTCCPRSTPSSDVLLVMAPTAPLPTSFRHGRRGSSWPILLS